MANTMATMQGCCCEAMITNCTELHDWWSALTGIQVTLAATDNGCTGCAANSDGDWLLDSFGTAAKPLACTFGHTAPEWSLSFFTNGCVVGITGINGHSSLFLTIRCPWVTDARVTLWSDLGGSGGCVEIAERDITFPISVASLESGLLTNTGSASTPACHIPGDVPYECFS